MWNLVLLSHSEHHGGFLDISTCTTRGMQTTTVTTDEAIHRRMYDYPVYKLNPGNFVFYK